MKQQWLWVCTCVISNGPYYYLFFCIFVGYSNGLVSLLDVEREESISNLHYSEDIKNVYFSKSLNIPDYRQIYRNKTEANN